MSKDFIKIDDVRRFILGNFLWKILYKNLDLKEGVQGEGRVAPPCTPFKIQIFV